MCLSVTDQRPPDSQRAARAMKRALDVLAAAVGLCVLLPVMVAVALLVLLTEGSPLLYREYRVGRAGCLFPL